MESPAHCKKPVNLWYALVCMCYLLYKAILQACQCLEFVPWNELAYVIYLIYEECCIILHMYGLVTYAMLCIILAHLPSVLVLMASLGVNVMKQIIGITLLAYDQWCWLASNNGEQFSCCKTMDVFPISSEEEREILKNQKKKTIEVKEKPEKRQLNEEAIAEHRPETSQKTISKEQIENIRRSILTTSLTKENVKDMWLKKQQSRRGRRRWARMSSNALSGKVSSFSKDF